MKVLKIFILVITIIMVLGFNIDDILDDDSPSWNIDSDKDTIPDPLEDILGTDKYNVDSNNNLINDNYELEDIYRYKLKQEYINDNQYKQSNDEISEYMLLKISAMASERINGNCIGKTVSEVFKDKYRELNEFSIVRYENGEKGFGAIAIRKDNNIIIGYKPSRNYKDWIENFTTQFMPHPQRKYAIEFIQPIINKTDNIYISGHSLGGLLAQYATYNLYNDGYDNIKTITFNSASTLNPKHMKGKYGPPILKSHLKQAYKDSYMKLIPKKDSNNGSNITINTLYLKDFLNESIKENGFIDLNNKAFINSDFRKYDNFVKNYIISNDPIYIIINGEYLGSKKIIDVGKEELDFVKDKEKLTKYHELEGFIEILNEK